MPQDAQSVVAAVQSVDTGIQTAKDAGGDDYAMAKLDAVLNDAQSTFDKVNKVLLTAAKPKGVESNETDSPLVDWSDLGVSGLLPTGTVTLLLADVEGSTLLWETQPDDMAAAVARLERTLSDVVGAYGGVRPVEQGKGDSFVAAFARASDAVACALELQRAPLAPIRLRMATNGTTRRGVIACGSAAAVLAGWATGRFR